MSRGKRRPPSFFMKHRIQLIFLAAVRHMLKGQMLGSLLCPDRCFAGKNKEGRLLTGDAFCWNLIYETSIVLVELITAAYVETASFISSARNKYIVD